MFAQSSIYSYSSCTNQIMGKNLRSVAHWWIAKWDGEATWTLHPLVAIREDINWKKMFSFGHSPNFGGGVVYPCPNFWALFIAVHFWSIKRVYFFKNANVLNFNCFLGCIYTVYHIVYIVFLVLNWLSNLEFWPPKKRGPSCPNWGHGGGGV